MYKLQDEDTLDVVLPKEPIVVLTSVAQLVGASSCKPKGCGFNSWPQHMPRLQVQSLTGEHTGGNQQMFLSHI